MVGGMDLETAGQNLTVKFLGEEILLCFGDLKAAREIIGQPMPSLRLIGKLLSFSELRLKAKVGERKPIELFPEPSWVVRLLSPAIREMVQASKP